MTDHPNMESIVLKNLKAKPMSVSELAKNLNLRRDFLAGYLESMRERGILELVTVGKANVYLVRSGKK